MTGTRTFIRFLLTRGVLTAEGNLEFIHGWAQ